VPQQDLAIDKIARLGWTARWNSAGAVDLSIEQMRQSISARTR
jgi:hypothetical protein